MMERHPLTFEETGDPMATHAQLRAEPRQMLGKKVRRLRRAGFLPATVYGNHIEPQSIQVDSHELAAILRHAGRSQLIDLVIGDQSPRPVFIKQTAVDAKRHTILHVEFFQANLRERLTTRVPVHFVGESPAVKVGGIFLPVLDHVDIESLPDSVPAGGLEAGLGLITEMNGLIHASDLVMPPGVSLITPPDEILAKVNPPLSEARVEELIGETQPLPAELGGDETPPDAVPEA
jgi:large subunit ribosomal protein L25